MTTPHDTASFAQSAFRLAGLAARSLGWRPAEFWGATPGELVCAISDPDTEVLPMSMAEIETLLERESNG